MSLLPFSFHDLIVIGTAVVVAQIPGVASWTSAKIASVKRKLAVAEAAIKADEAKIVANVSASVRK